MGCPAAISPYEVENIIGRGAEEPDEMSGQKDLVDRVDNAICRLQVCGDQPGSASLVVDEATPTLEQESTVEHVDAFRAEYGVRVPSF